MFWDLHIPCYAAFPGAGDTGITRFMNLGTATGKAEPGRGACRYNAGCTLTTLLMTVLTLLLSGMAQCASQPVLHGF